MTSSSEVNSLNVTWSKDVAQQSRDRMWSLCFALIFLVGLATNVAIAFASARWSLLRSRLRHFRSLGDALVGHSASGVLTSACGLLIVITNFVLSFYQPTSEMLCCAGAALPQLVLSSCTTVVILFVFSHCDSVTCCGRIQQLLSTVRKVVPLVIGLTTAAIAIGDPASGSWLASACALHRSSATYRLSTALAVICFIASASGAILFLSHHLTLSRPRTTDKMAAEVLPVPLMELNATAEDNGAAGDGAGHVTSGEVTSSTCRIACEAATTERQEVADDFGSWRCSSRMGLPSMSSLLRSKSSLKSSQKSVLVKSKPKRTEDDSEEDSCEVRMRRLFQRRRTATCRRHTVANLCTSGCLPLRHAIAGTDFR